MVYIASSEPFQPKEICSMLEQSLKKVYSRTTTKSVPLLQPEHGYCQQNWSERSQVKDWYRRKKWWWFPFV